MPLAPQAVAVLRELRALPGSDASPFFFLRPHAKAHEQQYNALCALSYGLPRPRDGSRLQAMASTALNEMGFRPDVIERQLAHQEQNAVRAAYNHAEYLNERRAMMKRWADHLDKIAAENVVHFKSRIVMEN